ncbi:hypothetical protein BCR44DRAFT_1429114 [Catenaria anguillulae PL171]|uniref:Uncharacterized protein n=1 Tax=Catenaria anguillulae PL171 TaxID=765915 RepID=A0A1Y2HYX7_9FUNG|nr:hypothetical protein BCR44DRAFT_1429114 [Catenaria anguillulae PL171]
MPRKRKSAASSSAGASGDHPKPDLPVIQDSRFASLHNDPRFIPISKKQTKVKFGRPRSTTNKEDLERYYDFDSDSDASGSEEEDADDDKKKEKPTVSGDEEDEEEDEHAIARRRHAGLRGGLSDASDSDSDSNSSSDDFDAAANDLGSESEPDSIDLGMSDGEPDDEEGVFDEVLDRKHIPMGDATRRFAAVNMDWDHIKAADLFKVFDSLKPPGAVIQKVSVYPSEFGRECMAHEAQFGPALGGGKSVAMDAPAAVGSDVESEDEDRAGEEKEEPSEDESDADDDEQVDATDPSSRMKRNLRTLEMEEDDTDFDSVALRKYQLERLRYYYAVVECDTVDTAYTIFKAADGAEFEATSNFFDLRFIPDDVSFEEDEPARDVATPESAVAYRPIKFETKALQSSNVKLTWDEDDPDRAQITRKTLSYDELKALDFKDYVASDSDDDADASGDEADDEIAKYRALLGLDGTSGGANKGKKKQKRGKAGDSDGSDDESVHGDMEITFTAGLSETAERLMQEREERKKLENETTIEKYERKQRERRQRRKEARMQQEQGSDNEMIGGNVVGAGGADAADGEEMGFDDPFFAMDVDFDDAEEADRWDVKKPKVASATADGEEDGQPMTKKQKKQSKRKQREEEARREDEEDGVADFSVDASDSRFAPVLAEPEFAIDPTNPHFRDTPGMKSLLKAKRRNAAVKNKEKQQERQSAAGSNAASATNGGAKSNLLALADAVKRKTSAAMDAEAGQGRRNKKAKKA